MLHIHPLFPCPSFPSDFDRFFDQAKSPDGPHRARRRGGRRIKEEASGNATHRVRHEKAYLPPPLRRICFTHCFPPANEDDEEISRSSTNSTSTSSSRRGKGRRGMGTRKKKLEGLEEK